MITTQTAITGAAILGCILAHSIYRRRNPKAVPKVPKSELWQCPTENQLELCRLRDDFVNKQGACSYEKLAMWKYVAETMKAANKNWPENHTANVEIIDAVPHVKFTEKL